MTRAAVDREPWPGTLRNAGEMGIRISEHDWGSTPLGPIESWAPTLRSVVSLVAENGFPTILYWGDSLVAIYNDAYRPLLGQKPDALGRTLPEIWAEAMDTLGPVVERALAGEASFFQNTAFTLLRHGHPEEAWFDWGFSPVRGEAGTVVGVINTAIEQTRRTRGALALRESEQHSRDILESISDGLIGVDPEWRITRANSRAEAIFRPMHASAGDIVGRDLWEVFPGLAETTIGRNYLSAMRKQETTTFEAYYAPLDGWFDIRAYPSRHGLSIYFLDITERKRSETALRRSERLLQAVLDQLPSGVYVAEAPSGRILYHNQAAEAILGHPRIGADEIAEYAAYPAYRSNGSPYAAEEHPLARALRGERIEREEVVYGRADGEPITLAASAAPIRDEHEEVALAVCAFHDITHLKHIQEELRRLNETLEQQVEARTLQLREQEERFRSLVQASASSVWSAGAEGDVVEDSETWSTFTGQTREASRGVGWLEAVHPADRDRVREDWERCVAEGASQDIELRVWHAPTESYRWVSGRAVPLYDEDGSVRGWIGMDVDIDERKRAEGRVRELAARLTVVEQEERRRIAQILHDDLQQMLHGVDMKVDAALQDLRKAGSAEEGHDLSVVMRDLEEARWWIAHGITTARNLTADVSPPILRQESLADTLRWLRRHMRDLHGLEVDIDIAEPFPLDDTDLRVLLFDVARELLVNVTKHAGVTRADLEVEEEGGRLVIHVIDEGCGFDVPEVLAGEDATSGFGLFSVQERLGLVGGRLEIDSAPGEGTHVRVYSPVVSGSGAT